MQLNSSWKFKWLILSVAVTMAVPVFVESVAYGANDDDDLDAETEIEPETQEVRGVATLKYKSRSPAARAYTRAMAWRQNYFSARGSQATVRIAGKQVNVAVRRKNRDDYVGLDCDSDGQIKRKEWKKLSKSGKASFSGTVDSQEFNVRMIAVEMWGKKNEITYMKGRCFSNSSMSGQIEKLKVHLIDDNQDGIFTQNGNDAILTGSRSTALPLMKRHRIGKEFYELTVSGDGGTIEYVQLKDVQMGKVKLPLKSSILRSCVLWGSKGSYDLKACRTNGIPAGKYRLCFGVLKGKEDIAFSPDPQVNPKYTIAADSTNKLPLGTPIKVHFSAQLAGSKLTISPGFKLVGAGGEVYRPIALSSPKWTKRPSVTINAGRNLVHRGRMDYEKQWLRAYTRSVRSIIKNPKATVKVTVTTRDMGTLSGKRTLKDIRSNVPQRSRSSRTVSRK